MVGSESDRGYGYALKDSDEFAPASPNVQKEALRQERVKRQQEGEWHRLLGSPTFNEFLIRHLERKGLELKEIPNDPPCDVVAERACMGALLMHNQDVIHRALLVLRPAHLYVGVHTYILRAVAVLSRQVQAGKPIAIDLVAVATQLRKQGHIGARGSALSVEYLEDLVSCCPSAENVETYIKPVIETAKLRALQSLGETISAASLHYSAEPMSISADIRQAIDEIEARAAWDRDKLFKDRK